MSQKRATQGRMLFYLRDSGGEHEMTPSQYVRQAQARAKELKLKFDGTPEAIERMRLSQTPVEGDLYFDYIVKGHLKSRPALDALIERVSADKTVSHVYTTRRDRFSRPHDTNDAVQQENVFRRAGVTLIFRDKLLPPLLKNQRQDLGEAIAAYVDYDQSGKFCEDLAEKILLAQLQLAQMGLATGGRAPFGFRRFLVSPDREVVRELNDGEVVRQAGHHVVWLPGPESELKLVHRILDMYEVMPATRIAKIFNAEGIPSPHAGRTRKIRGVKQPVSGLWRPWTINNIVRNSLLVAVTEYGRRSIGDRRRFTPQGPRLLEDNDRQEDGKLKTVRNDPKLTVKSAAKFPPLITEDRAHRLLKIHEQRAGTQRSKPRSRDPNKNPLGGRIFDWNCGWLMYRIPHGDTFNYTCGLYQQSHATRCSHNHVRGLAATKLALGTIWQQILAPHRLQQIEKRLRARVAESVAQPRVEQELERLQAELRAVQSQHQKAIRNFAIADTPQLAEGVKTFITELCDREAILNQELSKIQGTNSAISATDLMDSALAILRQLPELADDDHNLADIGQAFRILNLQMFVRFQPIKKKVRVEHKVSSGVITLGDALPPTKKYTGPTATTAVKATKPLKKGRSKDSKSSKHESESGSDGEAKSSRNVYHRER